MNCFLRYLILLIVLTDTDLQMQIPSSKNFRMFRYLHLTTGDTFTLEQLLLAKLFIILSILDTLKAKPREMKQNQ